MSYKEVYCTDCKEILGKYSTKYFSDHDIDEMVRQYCSLHIKEGHRINIRQTNV